MTRSKATNLILFSIIVAILDGVFKFFALTRLPNEGSRALFPIDFLLHKNPGIAFDIPIPMIIIFLLTLVIVFSLAKFGIKTWKHEPEKSLASALIVIGALGNLFDRFLNNFTTDYIILFGRSAINLSDILIISGTILLLWYTEDRKRRTLSK